MQPIKKILIDNGFNAQDLQVKFEPPISFFSDVDISQVLEINEMREIIGYEDKPNYDKLSNQKEEEDTEVKEGFHKMPDGSVMADEDMKDY